MTFRALVVDQLADGTVTSMQDLDESALPDGAVAVRVEWSTLNYKDGLILRGQGGIVRSFPHVPGIDFAGTVTSSRSEIVVAGERVLITGWRVGESRWGGYAERAVVEPEWVVKLPPQVSTRQAMAYGTAGLTAMLAVSALEVHNVQPSDGRILVTGSTGGVGTIAVHLLSQLGFEVVASTGKESCHKFLRALGAAEVIDRIELESGQGKPLLSGRWAGAIDTVGGATLSNVIAATHYGGVVAACGLVGGTSLTTTVLPFILRGVALIGIESVECPVARREAAWSRLWSLSDIRTVEDLCSECLLDDLPQRADDILAGAIIGRTLVRVA